MKKTRPNYSDAITEALFIALPFLVLIIIKSIQGNVGSLLTMSDFSLATSIMYGQLLSRTLSVPDKIKKEGNFKLFQVVIFIFSLLSIIIYASFQLVPNVSQGFYWAQILLFIVGLIFYIPTLTLMNNKIQG
jgi:phosphatidylglycerophosphate synthase